MASSNLVVSTGAASKVPVEVNTFQTTSWYAIGEAREALDNMARLRPEFPPGDAVAGKVVGSIKYVSPGAAPKWSYNFIPPTWDIQDPSLETVVKDGVEDFTGAPPSKPNIDLPSQPNIQAPTDPGSAPNLIQVTIPDAPELSNINDPKEYVITIPSAPAINIPSFTGSLPDSGHLQTPSANFSWQEDPYSSEVLSDIVERVGLYFDGGVGIPPEVWEALWARENDRENRASDKLVDEVNTEWSSRGFTLPQGIQIARIDEVRQTTQNASVSRSRDIATQEATLEIENLKFAVQQGIALETLRGGWEQATQARLLEATKFSSELSISVYNAQVSLYNAQIQLFSAEVQAYRIQIEAALTDLEVYKANLEGQKIIGDLNLQQVQIYTSRVQALNLEIDRYNAVLAGIKTTVETDAIKIEAYKSEVQAYGEKVKAIAVSYQAYSTAMDGANIQSSIYDTSVKAYASTVGAYSAKIDASVKKSSLDIEVNKYKLDEYQSNIQAYNLQLDAEVKKLDAQSTAFDAEVKGFAATIEDSKASLQAQTAQYTNDIQLASQTTQANIENARTNANNASAEAKIIQDGLNAIANINGAYAGSAMAAVNMSMGISDSAGNSASV